jgi:hypothetical protein
MRVRTGNYFVNYNRRIRKVDPNNPEAAKSVTRVTRSAKDKDLFEALLPKKRKI